MFFSLCVFVMELCDRTGGLISTEERLGMFRTTSGAGPRGTQGGPRNPFLARCTAMSWPVTLQLDCAQVLSLFCIVASMVIFASVRPEDFLVSAEHVVWAKSMRSRNVLALAVYVFLLLCLFCVRWSLCFLSLGTEVLDPPQHRATFLHQVRP